MQHKRKSRGLGGWVFLLLVIAAYGAVAAADARIAGKALSFAATVTYDLWPTLVIVFFLLLAADLLLEPQWIRRNLGKESGIKGWLLAAFGGVLATGPVYAWYALLGELREKGMRMSLAAVFLYSRALKLPLLPLMIHYFGFTYTFLLYLYLLVFSMISGILMLRLEGREAK
jgi:uncharacterized membrane protein YraQ (UPF0718 family)